MAFEKPLRAFLSYAHTDEEDNPKLFREFRNQLKSLEDDGIIKVWCDRDITAGLKWDQEIQRGLYDCHLFLALTSANFNASNYISGIEMRTALERHEDGACRIIPIMWRDWRPPKIFDALQFPNRNDPVADAEKKDAVLRALTGHIELVVAELTEGRWISKKRPPLVRIDPALAYLCDWTRPILQLSELKQAPGVSRRPCVLLLLGNPGDCADEFLTRTHRVDLPRALEFEAPVHDMCLLDWPSSPDLAVGFLHRCLGAQPGWEIERKLREGLTPVRTVTLGWDTEKEAVFSRILGELSGDAWALPPNRCLLLAVLIVVANWRKRRVQERIESLAGRWPAIRIAAVTLPKIEREHALNWPEMEEVRKYRGDKSQPLNDQIRRAYGWRRRLAMKRLAPRLLTILQESRRQGAMA
jgi:hypothetical protein